MTDPPVSESTDSESTVSESTVSESTAAEGANAMPGTEKPPLSRRLQVRAFRIINVPMRAVLGLPVATPLGGSLMLAFIRGRKTGKLYRQPISYVRDGDTLLTPGGGKWKLNLRPEMPVRIRLRGQDMMAAPELVSDPAEIDKLLMTITEANPRAAAFIGVPRDADGHFDRDGLDNAVRYGFRIVRWHPVPG
jgi:F420H(2)-dependent quinone reductase